MSTLTKVLIVLLTLSSIFLCGIVVTYVASANNWKAEYETEHNDWQAAKSLYQAKMNAADEQIAEAQRKYDMSQQDNTALIAQLSQTQADLAVAKQSNFGCQERLTNLGGVVSGLNQTISSMDQSLTLSRSELDKVRGEQVKNRKELNEIAAALNEKTVQLEALENERRRLLEEKASLDSLVAQAKTGGQVSAAQPVTQPNTQARQAAPATSQAVLKGKIIEANLSDNIVTVSLGSADGMQKGMRLHVVRGDTFICDIVITNVDVDRSAGTLELVRGQPKVGDSVSTSI